MGATDKGAEFAWKSIRDTLIYTVNRIPEIADDVVNVDNAKDAEAVRLFTDRAQLNNPEFESFVNNLFEEFVIT